MALSSRSVVSYAIAAGSVVLATILQSFFGQDVLTARPFLLYYPAILLVLWIGGWRPAAVAAILGGGLASYYFCEPVGQWWMEDRADQLGAVQYAVICVTIVALVARLKRSEHNAYQRAEEAARAKELLAADIARREQAEEALRQSERRFRGTFENAAVGVTHTDREGRWLDVNQRFCDQLGYAREELLGMGFIDRTWPADAAEDWRCYSAMMRGEIDSYSTRKRYLRKDGSLIWMEVTRSVQRDESGRPLYAINVSQDITERKAAEDARREAEERLRTAQEAASAGVWEWDLASGQSVLSEACFRLWGLPSDPGPVCYDWFQLMHPEDRQRMREIFQATLERGTPLRGEYRVVHPDGQTRWLMTLGRIVGRDSTGRPNRLSGITLDVTERKQMERELHEARAAAEAATQSKSAFLANMSHELRTPMTAILGMTELALEEEMPPGVRDCLETVKSSADTLLALLNDLLDFSRIEAGKLALEACSFRLRDVVAQTLKILSVRAEEKGVRLTSEIPEGIPDTLVGDPLRLRQILTNLIGNAIKFTERGEVVVRINEEREAEDEANGPDRAPSLGPPPPVRLRFEIVDTGIGISPEQQQRIFAPFTQADASTTRRFGGTGLGLSITSNLVQLMGGQLAVRSELGRGSTFFFTLRFLRPAHPVRPCSEGGPPGDRLEPMARPLRILLAEDTPANQKLIVRILTKRGHRVEVAANGREAVDLFARQDFDLVLMDVQMPVMDGFQATAAIRMFCEAKARVPIVAMTAHAMKSDRDRCLAAGMDDYLAKPIESRELLRTVENAAGRAATA